MGDSSDNSSSAADSYIGSLISLTSKSEIRYEGILYSVDRAKSSIALQEVRSFGTEGRKKDCPQIPPSDKVYDYIIFRGTDIKDLQVKSSPAARPAQPQQAHHDPAIVALQTRASPMAPSSGSLSLATASTATASAGSASTDGSNRMPYPSIPSAAYPSHMSSLYPPYAGSWQQIPPGTNGAMANMPVYWPAGFYRPPYLPQPPPYQLPPVMPSNYASHPPHQLLATQVSLPLSTVQSEGVSLPMNGKDSSAVVFSGETTSSDELLASISSASKHDSSSTTEERIFTPLSNPQASFHVSVSTISNTQSTMGASSEPASSEPPLVISNKVESRKSLADKRPPLLSEHSVAERSATREPLISAASTTQMQSSGERPLLPLPVDSLRHHTHISQASGNVHRGRGRGRGIRNHVSHSQVMEEFDFTAMNEKFNKDEVWGELGKADLKERGEVEEDVYEDTNDEDKPVYVKDDFFDTLSCDMLDRERNKLSEQRKIDVETFGRYTLRPHGVRGGRGGFRGGYRGGYYGGRAPANGSRGRFYPRNHGGY